MAISKILSSAESKSYNEELRKDGVKECVCRCEREVAPIESDSMEQFKYIIVTVVLITAPFHLAHLGCIGHHLVVVGHHLVLVVDHKEA